MNKYDFIGTEYKGITLVREGKLYFYLDKNGAVLNENGFENAESFDSDNPRFATVKQDNTWFHIDKTIKPIYSQRYECADSFERMGCTRVKQGGKWFHINTDGNALYEKRFDDVGIFKDMETTWVKDGTRMYHIYKSGEPVYKETYHWVSSFVNGVAKVRHNGKEFYINKSNKKVNTPDRDIIREMGL